MSKGRVVQVVRSHAFAGVERYIADTASELAARGWDITVIGGDPEIMRRSLPDRVVQRPARTLLDVVRQLRRLEPPDVVHAHMTAAELPAAVLKRSSRLVVTRHFSTRRGRSPGGRAVARFIENRIDVQIAISQFVADATDTPCVVIHNGVAPSERSAPRERVVVVLQRLEAEKETEVAIRAWRASGLAADGWRLRICGRGSERDRLVSLAAERTADGIEFAGFVDDARLELARAAVLVAPAPAEPFGLVVVEAMAEGTPVIAADGGAHRETLGEDGVYFAPGDAERCAFELRRLVDDPATSADVGSRLQARQRELFTVAAHVDRLERAYGA